MLGGVELTNPVVPEDPWGIIKNEAGPTGVSPSTVKKFHSRDDTDGSQFAHHHTLGVKHDQAAAGDHAHDGSGSRKIGAGLGLTCDTGVSTATDLANLFVMLHKVIEFTEV